MSAPKLTSARCLEAALRYRELGWSVLALCPPDHRGMNGHRCESPGKRPWHRWKDLQDRLPTVEEINQWFRQHQNSNVGVALGPVSGIVRIDVDGDEGRQFLAEMAGGDIPATLRFSSGGGGEGLLFAIPQGVELRTTTHTGEQVHSEIRFQGKGAQTVVPPSLHVSGRRYEWLPGCGPGEVEPALMPGWLVEKMRVLPKTPTATQFQSDPEHDRQVALSALTALSPARCDNHDDWVNVGMALHSVDESLLPEWDAWSRGCSDKYRDGECAERWASFNSTGGLTIATLVKWAQDDSPGWKPPRRERHADGTSARTATVISNANVVKTDEGIITAPRPMSAIIGDVIAVAGDEFGRVGGAIFVDDGGIHWLQKPSSLMGFLGSKAGKPAKFHRTTGCHTKDEVFAELQRKAKSYDAIETMPHEPQIAGHYYVCETPRPGTGESLRGLIGRFDPETDIDGDLIAAMFATAMWGGRGGSRPAFVITSDAGRGVGKTKLATMFAHLFGGVIELSPKEDIAIIKQRLLSPDAMCRRIVLIDNVKAMRFSWAELEALITASVISGKALYVGEATRPNILTYVITLNGVAMATDMAQRSVIVKINRPIHSGLWEEETRSYIDRHREQIIADLVGLLRSDRNGLQRFSRWGAWERDVLQRLPEPSEAQAVILERQQTSDVEKEEAEIIEEFIAEQLDDLRYDTSTDRVFIPSKLATDWVNRAANKRDSTTFVARMLKQKIEAREMSRLEVSKSRTHGRGFVWWPNGAPEDSELRTDIQSRIKYKSERE